MLSELVVEGRGTGLPTVRVEASRVARMVIGICMVVSLGFRWIVGVVMRIVCSISCFCW